MPSKQKQLTNFLFGENFLKDHAGRIIREPSFALQEIVANSWDAGATKMSITVPKEINGINGIISFEDNGVGMTELQFIERWKTFNYNRTKSQGKIVVFPDGTVSNRKPYGRNGKGRHAMFCFADSYNVETWRDGEKNIFEVKKYQGVFQILPTGKIKIEPTLSGTIIQSKVIQHFIDEKYVMELIGSKFVADPSFEISVNGKKITSSILEKVMEKYQLNTNHGFINIELYDTQNISRTTQWSGIVWRVNNRMVGTPSWKMARTSFLDGRKMEARRYTFVINADILEDEVKTDWSGFIKNDKFNEVFSLVSDKIIEVLQNIFKEKRSDIKKNIIQTNAPQIKKLTRLSRDKIEDFIDSVQINCPSISEKELGDLIQTLISLEESTFGYDLLAKLAKVSPSDIDDLNDILSKWTIIEAKTVLDDLEKRLKLIKELQSLVEKKSDELHELQPIFNRALWIFGADYDTSQYTSNQTINNVIKKFFNKKYKGDIRERPYYVIIPATNSIIGIYATNDFDEKGEVSNFRKVVIIELKKGQSKITQDEMNQATEYARILRTEANLPRETIIVAYVLGSTIEQYIEDQEIGKITYIYPMTYNIILEKAHARTFNLINKIKEAKKIKDDDREIKTIFQQKTIFNTHSGS